ncbi:hypothetical protein FB567DRAFT_604353 [Paraphoma chrysanthemicola]|uniref:C2H2-type domain-containing protein n=1 Tax=Paraphoma chrysanthemicola TaxID=798071 RepID=A0A8K0R314_9PLEO|nr:hypothetical protein FB567DRAFT_604353 [Paraphoma chrysanthemicola]
MFSRDMSPASFTHAWNELAPYDHAGGHYAGCTDDLCCCHGIPVEPSQGFETAPSNQHADQRFLDVSNHDFSQAPSQEYYEAAQLLLGDYVNPSANLGSLISGVQASNAASIFGIAPASPTCSSFPFVPAPALAQALVPSATPITAAPQLVSHTGLTCPHCGLNTFGRPGEYRRHMKKHAPGAFPCTQPGCSKTFYRKDKLRDHLRQGHKIPRS